jgi:hypothetical protein
MEAASSSETPLNFYQTTRHNNPEDKFSSSTTSQVTRGKLTGRGGGRSKRVTSPRWRHSVASNYEQNWHEFGTGIQARFNKQRAEGKGKP